MRQTRNRWQRSVRQGKKSGARISKMAQRWGTVIQTRNVGQMRVHSKFGFMLIL